jgi:hypothetical protein
MTAGQVSYQRILTGLLVCLALYGAKRADSGFDSEGDTQSADLSCI